MGVALAVLMRISKDRARWLGAEALRRLAEAPLNDQRRFLLGECVQVYLTLDELQQKEFEKLTVSDWYQKVKVMNTLVELLEDRFSPLPQDIHEKLKGSTMEELARMIKKIHAQNVVENI